MNRWIVWSQAGYAVIMAVLTFADRGVLPKYPTLALAPSISVFPVVVFVLPLVVLVHGTRGASDTERVSEVVASVGLAIVTVMAALPAIQ